MSTALHLLGDRWSLLLLRELAVGNGRYGEILTALPGISRSLLSSRLRHLERAGLCARSAIAGDKRSPHRYVLTEAGAELSPVMDSLARWSTQWMTHVDASEQLSVSDLIEQVSTAVDRTLVPDGRVRIAFVSGNAGREEGWVDVGDFGSHAGLGSTAAEADLTVKASLRVLNDLWSRRRSCDDTVLRRDIAFDGPISYARAFTTWFPRRPGDASSSTPS